MKSTENTSTEATVDKKKLRCGIIMPIAPHKDYLATHWNDVRNILEETILETEFEICLVWDDPAVGLIHERIVNNIYDSDIVICDVSSKNPNVMFELGLRLAFDKPTIIIKDELTGYSFDTGVIDHIPYPSSLRFSEINNFKTLLKERIEATYKRSQSDENYSPFLKQFGTRIVPKSISKKEISENKYLLQKMDQIQMQLNRLSENNNKLSDRNSEVSGFSITRNEIDILKHTMAQYMDENGVVVLGMDDLDKIRKSYFNRTGKRIPTLIMKEVASDFYSRNLATVEKDK